MALRATGRLLLGAIVTTSLLLDVVSATSGTFSLPIERRSIPHRTARGRRDTQAVTINNTAVVFYTANVSIGVPPQIVTLAVDTGSSDLWVFDPKSCQNVSCFGGSVSPSRSSTLKKLDNRPFSIEYVDGSKAQGAYYQDRVSIGNFNVSQQVYAVASEVQNNHVGLLGLGYAKHETAALAGAKPYPSLLDNMFDEKVIGSKSFSMWLDAVEAPSGQMLFGGYDTDKYVGDLIVMNTQPDAGSGVVSEYVVPWTGVSISNGQETVQLTAPSFAAGALLDSGTSGLLLPQEIVSAITSRLANASYGGRGTDGPCSAREKINGTIDFAFGGAQGGIVHVPIREMWAPLFAAGEPVIEKGEMICDLRLIPMAAGSGPYILGDNFLRSAYVVHDLERNQTGIANTSFDSKENKAAPIPAGGLTAIPGAIVATNFNLGSSYDVDMLGAPKTVAPAGGSNASFAVLPQPTEAFKAEASKASAPRSVPVSLNWGALAMFAMFAVMSGTGGMTILIF